MKNQFSPYVIEKVDLEKVFELKKWKKVDIKKGPTPKLNLFPF
jgi:ribosome biogenesis GTPase A